MILSALWIYPIKSLQGIALQASDFDWRGLKYDRRWMLVDPQGKFLTQRQFPEMAQWRVEIHAQRGQIQVYDSQDKSLSLPLPPYGSALTPVKVWSSRCAGQRVSAEADAWFSERLGIPCHLVYQPENATRAVSETWAPGHEVSFADGYPFLICSESSLADLSEKVGSELDMRAFRPNLVIQGAEPWAERKWTQIQLGRVCFQLVKPCARCVIITFDPQTGQSQHPELLKQLTALQRWRGKPVFGINAVCDAAEGHLQVGDRLIPSV